MPPAQKFFILSDTLQGVFDEICKAYNIDQCFLSWQYERAILTGSSSPVRISTGDISGRATLKDGVEKVDFEIEFLKDSPNTLKWIKFSELPSKKFFVVTQTSIDHIQEGTSCRLWTELPPGARKDDIGAVHHLLKVDICCKQWRDFIPTDPVTELEKAQKVLAMDSLDHLRIELIHKDLQTIRLTGFLAARDADLLKKHQEIRDLQEQLDEAKGLNSRVHSLLGSDAKRRRIATPNARKPKTPKAPSKTPKTAPAKVSDYQESIEAVATPSKDQPNKVGSYPAIPIPLFPNLRLRTGDGNAFD